MGDTKAKDLGEGDRVDFDPASPYLGEVNRDIASREYAAIKEVRPMGPDVALIFENDFVPIVLPADTVVHVERWH